MQRSELDWQLAVIETIIVLSGDGIGVKGVLNALRLRGCTMSVARLQRRLAMLCDAGRIANVSPQSTASYIYVPERREDLP